MGGSGIEPHYPALGFQFLHGAGCVMPEVFFLSDFPGHSLIVKLDISDGVEKSRYSPKWL